MDIDLAGKTSNDLEHIHKLIASVCQQQVEADGIEFVISSITASRIKEDAEYGGVRVRLHALLAGARIPVQIDIGFGDVIVPSAAAVSYPAMLEFHNPVLIAYSKESVIAEKLEALTSLGTLNSRMKDYFDIWLLSQIYEFDGPILLRAIEATFQRRGTVIESHPLGLSGTFASDPGKNTQWKAFLRRSRFDSAPASLQNVLVKVSAFVGPVLAAAANDVVFPGHWNPGSGWR